jgi:short subunit dehydrogenase-like uncharacterized protein
MIYGAYGFTGALIAEEAVRRGHRPVLAGRSAEKLAPLAERLDLPWVAVDLNDAAALAKEVGKMELVYHAAGPFVDTSAQMVEACLAAGAHYLDITGDLHVLRRNLQRDREARECGIVVVSGAGFDVIPTDCLAAYLATRLPDALELWIDMDALTTPTAGTVVSSIAPFLEGGAVRRNGELQPYRLGEGARRQRFMHGEKLVMPLPIADLVTAYHTTGIPNITTSMAVPPLTPGLLGIMAPVIRGALRSNGVRNVVQKLVRAMVKGPSEKVLRSARSHIHGRVRNATGMEVEAWLEVSEPYHFTAVAAVHAVENVMRDKPAGALTPALALGADFVLEIEGSRRYEE